MAKEKEKSKAVKEKPKEIKKEKPTKKPREKTKGITVKKEDDMAEWYIQVCLKSELAEYAPTKGCYIIRPLGMAIWEKIQEDFNKRIKAYGVSNTYFPLFIPESFFQKEAEHAKGFHPEVAWIEKKGDEEEKLAVRPTSETIMCDSFSRWVRSWRDLPLRINQWCNIVRWETHATKLFLRSREFLWQEGHCVYETEPDADTECILFLNEYKDMLEKLLAIPIISGKKTEKEKFAGAKYTYSIEAFMPDGKAIQAGTSHNLGQGFMTSFDVSFLDKDGKRKRPWHTSWGMSTRVIGTMVMLHSDDKGLVLPPRVAPNKVVIVPIIYEESRDAVLKKADQIREMLKDHFNPILDERDDYNPGFKFNEWELKGIPIRIEIGPKDLETDECVLVRRDSGEKQIIKINDVKETVAQELKLMHEALFKKAKEHLEKSIVEVNTWGEFVEGIKNKKLVLTTFCGEIGCEDWIKDKTEGATSRNIPLDNPKPKPGSKCIHCKKPARCNVYFSKAY